MSTFKNLSSDAKDALAVKIGRRLATVIETATLGAAKRITLNETVDVWMLGASKLAEPTDDLRLLAKPTGRWHHQVQADSRPIAYARTVPLGTEPNDWQVVAVYGSTLASAFDAAMTSIDNTISSDSVVRLLEVPAFQLHAFWLVEAELVVVIDAPPLFKDLVPRRQYTVKEFLEALRSEDHIQGLTDV